MNLGLTRSPVGTPQEGRSDPGTTRRRDPVPYLLSVGFFVIYMTLSLSRYYEFQTMSWDLGIFEQVVRSYAGMQAPLSDLKAPGFVILGDHFSPVLALLAPIYVLAPSAVTLLVAQALLFAVAVVPVTRAARRCLGTSAGTAIGVAYGLSWGVQRAVDFDFHEIAFAVPMLAWSLEAVLRQRWISALLWAGALILVKEDLGLTAAVVAGLVAFKARQARPKLAITALGLAVIGVAACVLTVLVVIPAFTTTGSYDYWAKLTEDSGGLVEDGNSLAEKAQTLLWILLPTSGLLALRSPLLLAIIPTLAWRFTSYDEHYWSTDWHYNAVLMPIVTMALIEAITRSRSDSRSWVRAYAHHLPAIVVTSALALSTALPVASLLNPDTYDRSASATAADSVLATIPDGASVEANIGPIAHLTGRCRVFWIGNTRGNIPDYIAFADPAKSDTAVVDYVWGLHPGTTYEITASAGGYRVLRRTSLS